MVNTVWTDPADIKNTFGEIDVSDRHTYSADVDTEIRVIYGDNVKYSGNLTDPHSIKVSWSDPSDKKVSWI